MRSNNATSYDAGVLLSVSSTGEAVAETELADGDPTALIAAAREHEVELLWVHADADLSAFGFSRERGYVRLHGHDATDGATLPRLDIREYARLINVAYRGLWGHKWVPEASPPPSAVVLGLHVGGEAVGLCTVFPDERLVDGPGLVPGHRDPANYATLLRGACAQLGRGPVDIDSWGDEPQVIGAYVALGFSISEQIGGWQLRVR